jgi:hypothetical protein
MAVSKAATTLQYTEKELEAIEILKANRGTPMSAKDLGITTAILTSLGKKADKFPTDENVVRIVKSDYSAVCPTCGNKISHKLYEIA